MNREGFIYAIENKINGKCYVGKTINLKRRKRDHFNGLEKGICCNEHLQKSFSKYGRNAFEFKIIEKVIDNNIFDREIYWIKKLNAFTKGYNMNSGGKGFGAGEGAPWHDKHLPEYMRRKISQTLIRNGSIRGKNHPFYGKHQAEGSRKKISKSLIRFFLLDEISGGKAKDKLREAIKKRFLPGNSLGEEITKKLRKGLMNAYLFGNLKERKSGFGKEKGRKIYNEFHQSSGITYKELADKYSISAAVIGGICRGQHWTVKNYKGGN